MPPISSLATVVCRVWVFGINAAYGELLDHVHKLHIFESIADIGTGKSDLLNVLHERGAGESGGDAGQEANNGGNFELHCLFGMFGRFGRFQQLFFSDPRRGSGERGLL